MAETASSPPQNDYPNLNPYASRNGNGSLDSAKGGVMNTAQSAMDTVSNHPITQGPVAEKARAEVGKTSNEFSNLANSRTTPERQTATGQNLTHYHSMFYNLLSWENPRATGIAFGSSILLIFAFRYVPMTRYALKLLWMALGITAAAEFAGKLILDKGLASHLRPRQYYTIPRESLEAMLEDIEQLINFFVIEFQRILFAENVYATTAAFFATLIGYFAYKFMPKWGLALLGTSVVYLVPLVYIKNQEVIDGHLNNAHQLVSQQANQVRDLANQQAGRALEATKQTAGQYGSRAQEFMGANKSKAGSPEPEIVKGDFPSAPTSDIKSETAAEIPAAARAEEKSAEPMLQ